jgi:predicted NACHT family NTPase
MEPPVRLALAKKIDSLFTPKGWKDSELEPTVSASTIQKMRNQNYVPKDRMLGKISDALKTKNVLVEHQELVDLARQQRGDLASGQEPSLSSKWEEYLETTAPTRNALTLYLQRYIERYGQIRLLGMSQPMLLKEIYTDVQMVDPAFLRKWRSLEDLETAFRRSSRRNFLPKDISPKDGMELANMTQFLNVLGQPGAGKSTFLRKVGLEALLPPEKRKFSHCCVPVYVELKRCKAQHVRLAEIIQQEFSSFGFPTGFSELALRHGKLLVLLDGLDEVPTDNLDDVVEDIREFVDTNSSNRFITSCRTAFYKTWFTRFTDVVLADFKEDQIQAFLRNWFRSPMDLERKTAEKFWDMLKRPENHATLELAGRPLLLTFICLFHDETLSLPANRSDLYEGAFRILLEKWAAEKRIRNDPICHGLTTKWEIILLEQIAGPAFEEKKVFFTENELTNIIDRFLLKDLNAPDVEGRDVMEAIEIQQGLLVKRAQNIYSFSHLSEIRISDCPPSSTGGATEVNQDFFRN